jgi:hypothetical protein
MVVIRENMVFKPFPITVPLSLVVLPIAAIYPFNSSSETPKVFAVAAAFLIPSAKSLVVIA